MTRKDYVLIAAALKRASGNVNTDEQFGVAEATVSLADALARDNPRFDRERFLRDAGVQS